jgi:tellurite resistance protein TerC
MNVSLTIWGILIAVIALLVIFDLLTVSGKPHEVKFKEAAFWSIFYIGIALIFGWWVYARYGSQFGTEYITAYLVEKSLSVDNVFVFAIILGQFAVPAIYQQRILLIGVVLALVFRAIFIAIGAQAIEAFSFTFVLFGALLIWTGINLFKHRNEDPDPSENFAVKRLRKRIAITDEFHGSHFFTRIDGKRYATPMFLVLIAVGSTDLLFALDSIPATFGVTEEPFLVFSANAFALLGLRALYFLLAQLLERLIYLSLGLSVILIFIGLKLIAIYAHEINHSIPKIETSISLLVIGVILFICTVASLIKTRKDPSLKAHAGRLVGHSPTEEGKEGKPKK